MSKLRPYKVRFHLGAGENYMKWRIEDTRTGEVRFYSPDSTVINMKKIKFRNNRKTAEKIHSGANKTVCAWVEAESVHITSIDGQPLAAAERVFYNPKIAPYWYMLDHFEEHELMDNSTCAFGTTRGKEVFLSYAKQTVEK